MMVFENLVIAFSSPVLFPLVVVVTSLFIGVLHIFFSLRYGSDAQKDTPSFLYGLLGLLVASSFLFGTSSLLTAVCLGGFLGEAIGLFSITLYKNKRHQ